MSDFTGLYNVRNFKLEDRNFILATFLRGVYYGNSWFSLIPKDIFMNNYKMVAEAILNNNRVVIKVACLQEDPDVILGYSILYSDSPVIHWVYVKEKWRKKGIARALTPKNPTAVTHLSALGQSLMNKFENLIFNPFA